MPDVLIDNKTFYNSASIFVKYFSLISKTVMVLFIIGFFSGKPESFLFANFIVKVLIALFLIYRFNSYRTYKIKFTELDRKLCYSAGLYILLISFVDITQTYVEQIRSFIIPYTSPIINSIKGDFNKIVKV